MKSTLQIYGMHCSSCARLIENGLSFSPGVTKAYVNYATEKAQIIFNEKQTNINSLISAVQKTGYRAEVENKNNLEIGRAHV